ncbi:acetyltransferase (GNAT) family protein [Clostridium puniceum]|uniref:Acetyltransferase (GNAT) family protein n=1 Tax=Clostridium puniceum TaxID=29367 RepID=A0A1S8T2F3_9CLOT|nr:GNAT family N-acetyltransferase [Clostridium puniceum]OOM71858.1 acetyltransferase (GNAT) family protein [Clostridium puniceum]
MKKLILKKKDGTNLEVELKLLDLTYIDKIMEIQQKIYDGLENKDFYSCSEKEEFVDTINGKGKILGCVSLESNELIAMGVYIEYGYEDHNYGYDIEIKGEELLSVGQIESTVVLEEYRGNKLQKIICEIIEQMGKDAGMKYMCATAAPNNRFSVNTFENLGYSVMADKLKYGGLRRYVLMKKIN